MSNHQAPGLTAAMPGEPMASRARLVAMLCIAALAGTGWVYLGLMVAAHSVTVGPLGPGMGPLDAFSWTGMIDPSLVAALCRSTLGPAPASGLALVFLMWGAMVLAMMLPTATPMVMTYADLADAAARTGERVAAPVGLVAGYALVWLGFALVATGLQWGLTRAASAVPALTAAGGLMSGSVFIGAGAYQFSALKRACLTLCQQPFPFFFTNWTTRPAGLFRLGLRQGLYCIGCCWAMMLVMFAVGAMNVVWMAGLGIVMTIEKLGTGVRFSRAVGAALVGIGGVVVAVSIAAHWPGG